MGECSRQKARYRMVVRTVQSDVQVICWWMIIMDSYSNPSSSIILGKSLSIRVSKGTIVFGKLCLMNKSLCCKV